MKIKNKLIKNTKLTELYLLKSKPQEFLTQNAKFDLPNENLTNLIVKFKKAMQIVYKYHKKNKKILFLGTPKVLENLINSKTNHLALPDYFNLKGLFINTSIIKSLNSTQQLTKKNKFLLTKTTNRPDLIIIFAGKKTDSIIKESYLSRIPIIEFNVYNKKQNYGYTVPSKIQTENFKAINNIFFIILNAMLTKLTKK